jgi:hypothetical protein
MPKQLRTVSQWSPMSASPPDACSWPTSGILPGGGFMSPRNVGTSAIVQPALPSNVIKKYSGPVRNLF